MTTETSKPSGTIVLGMPRSGTTLLKRLLDAHPEISCPPDSNVISQCARMMQEVPVNGGLSMGMISGLWFSGISEEAVVERVRGLALGFLEEICGKNSKTHWVEKSYFHGFLIEPIEYLFKDSCRYICLVRHGLDVAMSMSDHCAKIGTYPLELHQYMVRYPRPLEGFVHAWNDVTVRMRQLLEDRPEQAICVRYEDLVADPKSELTRILKFIGVSGDGVVALIESALGNVGSVGLGDWKTYNRGNIDSSSVKRWKEIDPETLQVLAGIVNETLVREGYDAIPVKKTLTVEQAKRRLKMGLQSSFLQSKPQE